MATQLLSKAIEGLVILVADSNAYTRKLTRMMLTNLGVKSIYEAADGVTALESIRTLNPDVMVQNYSAATKQAVKGCIGPGLLPLHG